MLLFLLTALAGKVTVPVDIGVGPSAWLISNRVFADQPVHTGLTFSIQAVLDKKWLKKNKRLVPKKYRSLIARMDEVRITPYFWIPESIVISPAWKDTGVYGISWRPFSYGIPWIRKGVRFSTSAGLRVTYLFLHSRTLPSPTHFVRPGLDLKAYLEIPFSDTVLVSLSWASHFYPPQRLGGHPLQFVPFEDAIWHVGQGTLKLHVRVPYRTRL